MWDLYVIGDAAYSAAILNGVASIFGSGNLGTLAGIGFIVGMLVTIGQGIITGGRGVSPGGLLIGLVVYLGLFAPTTDVRIHSASTGTVRVVANVPFGPAAIASMMSRIGHTVTELMEQGFAVPAMNDYGYASPIRTAALMRKATIDGIITDGLQSDNEALYQSFVNYVSECTMVGVQKRELSAKAIYNSSNPLDAMKWDNNIYRTRQYDDSGSVSHAPCGAAHVVLSSRVNTEWGGTTYGRFLAPALLQNIEELDATEGTLEQRAVKKVSEIAAILTGSGITNQQLGLNMLVYEMAQQGNLAFFDEHTDASKLAAMEQVRAQRNAAWQLEADNFASVMIPLITFFENFVFAISPLMVFIVFLGAGGLKLLGKYMFLVLWVQMWMPLMAVVNLYLMMSATGSMDTLIQGPAELGSFAMINYMGTEVNTWMGVAGKLLASIPAISLMLLYGTSQAATQIARGFEGSASASSAAKVMAPDTTSVGAAHSVSPMMQGSMVGGTHIGNAGERDYRIGSGNEFRSMEQSAEKESLQAKEAFSQTAGRGYAKTQQAREQGTISGSMATSTGTTESEANKLIESVTSGAMERLSQQGVNADRRQVQNQVAAQLSGNASLSAGNSKGGGKGGAASAGVGAGVTGSGSSADLNAQTTQIDSAIADTLQESHGSVSEGQMALSKAVRGDLKAGRDNVFSAGLSKEDKMALGRTAEAAVTNAEEHQATQALAQTSSLARGAEGIKVAKMVMDAAGSPSQAVAQVREAVQKNGLEQPYKQAMQYANDSLGLSGDQQKVWAGMAVLLGGQANGLSGARRDQAFQDGAQILNGSFNTDGYKSNDYSKYSGAAEGNDPGKSFDTLRDDFQNHNDPNVIAPVENGISNAKGQLAEAGVGMDKAPLDVTQQGSALAEGAYESKSGQYDNSSGLKADHHSNRLATHDKQRSSMKDQDGWEKAGGLGEYVDAAFDRTLGHYANLAMGEGVVAGMKEGMNAPGASDLNAPLSGQARNLESQISQLGSEGALAQYIGPEAAADAIGEVRNMAQNYGGNEMSPRAEFAAALALNDSGQMNVGTINAMLGTKEGITGLSSASAELATREYVYQGGTEPEMYMTDLAEAGARYNVEHGTSTSQSALGAVDSAGAVEELRQINPERSDFFLGRNRGL